MGKWSIFTVKLHLNHNPYLSEVPVSVFIFSLKLKLVHFFQSYESYNINLNQMLWVYVDKSILKFIYNLFVIVLCFKN